MDFMTEIWGASRAFMMLEVTVPAAICVFVVLWFAAKIPTKGKRRLGDNPWYRKFVPLAPLVLGIVSVLLPLTAELSAAPIGQRIMMGLWVGFLSAHGRKVYTRLATDKLAELKR